MNLVSALAFFALGAVFGAVGVARWWIYRLKDPETARDMLQRMYAQSHPHLLQVSLSDPTPVCPCCGWTAARP